MRAFYYLFILFNNLLSRHIHTRGEKFRGLIPQAPDERRLWPHVDLFQCAKLQVEGQTISHADAGFRTFRILTLS